MTKEEALKINELYRRLDSLEHAAKLQAEIVEKLKIENKMLSLAVNTDEVLNRLEKINKKKE